MSKIDELMEGLSEQEKALVLKSLREIETTGKSKTLNDIYSEDYEEIPVSIDEFIESPRYAGWMTNNGKNIYPYWRDKLRKIFDASKSYQEVVLTGCLSGDTMIPLLNGKTVSIKSLSEIGDIDEYVYSFDVDKNEFVPGHLIKAFSTGVKPVYRITFDNGECIKATSNHKFMTRDKHWASIDSGLSVGDSLMPFNTGMSKCYSTGEYITVNHPLKDGTFREEFVHRMVMRWKFGDNYKGVVHHKDFNKLNNDPRNLLLSKWYEHRRYHCKRGGENFREFNLKVKSNQLDENTLKRLEEGRLRGTTSRWSDENQHKEMSERIREMNINGHAKRIADDFWNSSKGFERKSRMSKTTTEFNKTSHPNLIKYSKEYIISELRKLYNYKQLSKVLGISNGGCCSVLKRYSINPNDYTIKCPVKFPDRVYGPLFSKYNKLYLEYGYLNDELVRQNCYKTTIKPSVIIEEKFGGDKEYFMEVVKNYNHKIVSIEYVGLEEVYDLTIEKYHNFALSCGIIAHNSIGIGKSTIAIVGLAYQLYKLMCLKDPHVYYNIGRGSMIYIVFFNATLTLSQGVAYTKFQSLLQNSPWFMERGRVAGKKYLEYVPDKDIRFTVGSTIEHSLGKDIFAGLLDEVNFVKGADIHMEKSKIMKTYSCLSGDTVVRTDEGNYRISDIEGKSVHVFEQNKWYMVDKSKEKSDVLCTKETDKFVSIELEDGTVLKVTPEHKLRLSNGEYKEAQYLTEEDILMEEINADNVFDLKIWKQFNPVSEDSLKDYFAFVLKCVAEDSNADNVQEHHILPKSLMCNNVTVRISPRNHFLCHKMLAENMFSGEFGKKMSYAFKCMCSGRHNGSYDITPEEYQESVELFRKAGSPMKGKQFSEEIRKHMSENHANFKGKNSPLYGRTGEDCPSYNTVIVNDGNNNIRIKKSELDDYLSKGYKKGYIDSVAQKYGKSNIGRVHITKDGNEKCVKIEDLDLYIKDGWELGIANDRSGENCSTYGKTVMNRNGIMRFVNKEEVDSLLEDGYEFGTGILPHNKNKICMNNGKTNVFVNEENVEYYIDNGYSIGMVREYKKRDKNVLVTEIATGKTMYVKDGEIPEGFIKGKLRERKTYKFLYRYDGKEFYGREEIMKYIRENTEHKTFSSTTLKKICNGISVNGYDSLYGLIERIEV